MNLNSVLIVCFGVVILVALGMMDNHILERVDTHVYLPKHAKCAVKMMYFKDANGERYPAVQEVCHWDNSYKQPKRPKPVDDVLR